MPPMTPLFLLTEVDGLHGGGWTRRRNKAKHRDKDEKDALGPQDLVVNPGYQPLPLGVHIPIINDAIMKAAPFASGGGANKGDHKFWWSQIASIEFQELLSDAFWFTIAHGLYHKDKNKNKKGQDNEQVTSGGGGGGVMNSTTTTQMPGVLSLHQSDHFRRISYDYVGIMKRVPPNKLATFKDHYEEVMAFALILCYQAAFPQYIDRFGGMGFVQDVIDLCTEWMRGFRPAKTNIGQRRNGTWIKRYFLGKQRDLRLLAQTSPLQHPSPLLLTQEGLLGGEEDRQPWGTVPDHYVPLRTRRVRYTFQHSPMMEQYLSQTGGRDLPHLAYSTTLTEAPNSPLKNMVAHPKEIKQMMAYRHGGQSRDDPNIPDIVRGTSQIRQSIFDRYASEKYSFAKDVHHIRKGEITYTSARPMTEEMKALMAAGDIHELSNLLTVMSSKAAAAASNNNHHQHKQQRHQRRPQTSLL